jgi:ABC-type Fe3+-siderophore transport system permease subunit
MQTLFRNPLADPFALGISSGASLGVAVVVLGSGMSVATAFGASTGLRGDALLGREHRAATLQQRFERERSTVCTGRARVDAQLAQQKRMAARLAGQGHALGLVGAVMVARLMASLLYGLSPADPVTFALVPVALTIVVLAATWIPARRAVALDPVIALKND